MIESDPAPPTIVSAPKPPSSTLLRALPVIMSSKAEPRTLSMPVKASSPPGPRAAPELRSTVAPVGSAKSSLGIVLAKLAVSIPASPL